jgi:hypothetical protein
MNAQAPDGSDAAQVAANGGLLGIQNTTDRVRYGKLGWTSAPTPNTVNELRFGLVEDRLNDPASEANLATGNVAITLAGATIGNPHPNADSLNERRYQLVDNLTAAMGTHTFRAGADLSFTRDTVSELNSAGMYFYPSLTAFAQDFTSGGRDYTSFTQEFGAGLRRVASRMYNLYAMDTWRPVDKLTIVAGVRWDRPRRPQPAQANPSYYQTGIITTPVVDFAPRISAALRADDRTVIRFGYAWFYAPMPGKLLDALYQGNGVTETSVSVNPNQTGAPSFPNILTGAIPAGTTNLMYASSKLRDPHTGQFNLVIERTLARDTTLSLSATRSRGFKLTTVNDANLAAPTITKTYAIDNAAGAQTGSYSTLLWNVRNDPNVAHVYNVLDTGSSWYSALAVELRKRMAHGLSVAASYTWSHSVDDVGGPVIAGFLPLNTTTGAVTADRADSPFDQRHRASVSWIWQPTVLRSGSIALRHVVNGWALSSIATLASGHPVTPLVLVSGQQFSGVTMAYTNSLNGSGGWNRVPFAPFGAFDTGRQYNVDARLSRTLDFTERVKGVLLFEAFNALNTQYDTGVNAVAWTSAPTAPPAGAVTGPMSGVLRPVNGAGTGNAASAPRQAQVAFRLVF